jgi:hypothetical protein
MKWNRLENYRGPFAWWALRGILPLIAYFLCKYDFCVALQASVRCCFTRVSDLHSHATNGARLGRGLFPLSAHAPLFTSD